MLERTITALLSTVVAVGALSASSAAAGSPAVVTPADRAAPEARAAASFPGANGLIAYTKTWDVTGTPGPDARSAIFTVRPDGTHRKRLTAGTDLASSPKWSPRGGRIAYEQGGAVWVMKRDGTAKQQLVDGELIGWLPTGGRILVAEGLGYGNGVQPTWTVYTMATGETEELPIELPIVANLPDPPYPDYSQWSYAAGAALSPDGQTLAVMLWRWDYGGDQYDYPHASIFTVGLDGTGLTRIPRYDYSWGSPAWSTAGDELVVWSEEPRSHRCIDGGLRSLHLDGSSGAVSISKPCSERGPEWSPNGKKIVFVAGSRLLTSNLAGTRVKEVVRSTGAYLYEPDWQTR